MEERAAAPFVLSHSHLKDVKFVSIQLHGLSDASQLPYTGVMYLRIIDGQGGIQTSLVISETKLTIPGLYLYRARATCLPLQGGLTTQ